MDEDLTRINVVVPQVTRESLDLGDDVVLNALFYPYFVFHLEAKLKRALGKPKEIDDILAVDLSRGVAARADSFPEVEPMDVSPLAIVPDAVNYAQALKVAKRRFLQFIMRKHLILLAPEIAPLKEGYLYKIFWLIEHADKQKYLVDSLSGNAEELSQIGLT